VSELEGFSPYRLDGDLLKLDLDAQMTTHEIPDELYLRELNELDVGSGDQILGFVNTYGRLGHPAPPIMRSDEGKLVVTRDQQIIRMLGVTVPDFRELPWDEWWTETDAHPGVGALGPIERVIFDSTGMQHIDAFKAWVLAFQRLTRLYQDFQNGQANEMEMVKLGIVIKDLMSPFTPVVDVVYDVDTEDWSPFKDTFVAPRLENLLALQMFNHVADGAVYHVCEFDNRLFVHQRGRAESGQHRSVGVKFCSTQCAQSQASRDYRRRNKAKKTKEA
jgi:hypothetical protein